MFTLEDWDNINIDSKESKLYKRQEQDRGFYDDAKQKINNAGSTINNAASNAVNDAGDKINTAIYGDENGQGSITSTISNQWDQTTGKISDTYYETKEKVEKILKIVKMLPWIIGGLFLLFFILSIALIVYLVRHHNLKNKRQKRRIQNLTDAVNNLTKVYCAHNNIEIVEEEEVVRLTVDEEPASENPKPKPSKYSKYDEVEE